MEFQIINLNTWKRKEYFEHYYKHNPCTYSMTVKIDITNLIKSCKKIYPSLLYSVTTIVNKHEEFRTAMNENGQIGIFSEMLPCYTIFHTESETFSTIWTEYTNNYDLFCKQYTYDIKEYGQVNKLISKPHVPINTFPISMIPWTTFEGFNLNLQNGYNYFLPIFTFGKFYEQDQKYYIPLSIQVHHAVCDGFHVSRFVNELQETILSIK